MGGRIIRQHFVPQLYLRQFSNNLSNGKVSRTYVYVKQKNIIVSLPISGVASREGFYDFQENDQTQEMEKFFSVNVESDYSILLCEIIDEFDKFGRIADNNRRHLSYQISIQYLRTENARISLSEAFESVNEFIDSQIQGRNISNNQSIRSPSIIGSLEHLKFLMNDENIKLIANIIYKHKWRILRAPEGRNFISSDNPVLLMGTPATSWSGVGFASYGAYVVFPIDAKHLLMTQDFVSFDEERHVGNDVVINIGEDGLESINGMILFHSSEQAVSVNKMELERAACWLKNFEQQQSAESRSLDKRQPQFSGE